MTKIKVLMVGNHPLVKGGITSVIGQLLSHDWDADGIDMTFVPTYIDKNAIVKAFYFVIAYLKILGIFWLNRPDVVHIHMSYKGSFYRKYSIHKLCKRYKVPDMIHLHGSEFKKWFDESDEKTRNKIRKLLQECDKFIVLGNKWNMSVKEIEPRTNTIIINNTIHIPDDTVQWSENKFQILFLGVLIKRKGIVDLIQAINILKEKKKLHKLSFVIAGSGTDEEYLKKQVNDYDLGSYVKFTGWINGERKEKLLKESQAFVLPSYNEGLPVAILEAMSYGMPIVATDVGDISSAVINDVNGYLIQPGDTNELANCLEKLSSNGSRYLEMSQMSRKIATLNFSDACYFAQIKKCYQIAGEADE